MSDDDHGVRPSEDQGGANQKPAGKRFPTVGIGTSAGGVHALQTFFESLPNDVDAAFVVVLHLDPSHQSELPNILANRTQMPVTQVSGLTLIEPRHVYVIPPNRQLVVTDDHLAITEFDEPRWQRAPIDIFFRSLAARRRDDFAIVLTGAGADGSLGSKRSRKPGASFWSRNRMRPNTHPCRAAQSRQVSRISFCRCGRSPPDFPSSSKIDHIPCRTLSQKRMGRDAAHSFPPSCSFGARLLELQEAYNSTSHRSENAGPAGDDHGRLPRSPARKSSGGAGAVRRSPHLGDDVLSRYERVRQACGVGHPSPVR